MKNGKLCLEKELCHSHERSHRKGSVVPFKTRMICLPKQQHGWSCSHAALLQQQNPSLSATGQASLLRSLHQTWMDLPLGNDKRPVRPSWLQHLQLLWEARTHHAVMTTPPPEKLIEGVAVQQIDSSWHALLAISSGWCRVTFGSHYATVRSKKQQY